MILKPSDINALETRFRANFINSIGGFKSLVLIGTKSVQGNENLSVFSSLFHIGANPPLCGVIVRPNEIKQNTLGNIINTKQFTVNHVLPDFYKQAHQCSAKYESGISEFSAVGLTPEYLEEICVPFVKESKIRFACELMQKIDLEINGTTLILCKIVLVSVPNDFLKNDGFVDLEKAQSITVSGLDSYHYTKKIARLSYAKVDEELKEI